MKTAAFITARGGSKGIPRKNLMLLAGRPLISYSIAAARDSERCDGIFVTTDDAEIKSVALSEGAEVIDRPAALASDTATSQGAVEHALSTLKAQGRFPESFILLQPTSPLRTGDHVAEAWKKFQSSKASSLMSVTELDHPPQKNLVLRNGFLEPFVSIEALSTPRQELEPAYRQNGAIYIVQSLKFLEQMAFYIAPSIAYIMGSAVSVDIDTLEDIEHCERYLARSSKEKKG